MPAPIVAFGVAKAVTWIVGILAGAWATNKVVKAFGNTPANDLRDAGIPKSQQFAAAQEAQKDRKTFLEKLNKERLDENKELKEQLDKLRKQLLQQTEEYQNETDPAQKKKKLFTMQATEKEIKNVEDKISQNELTINENNKKIEEALNKIGDTSNLTQGQFQGKADSINLTSYKNYIIIFICLVVVIMVIGFFKKLLASLLSSMK